jgi:hypothetical protein
MDTFSATFTIAWEVIEFDSVKSIQTGTLSSSQTETAVTVSSVDVSKAMLFVTHKATTSGGYAGEHHIKYKVVSATSISFRSAASLPNDVRWWLVEFN